MAADIEATPALATALLSAKSKAAAFDVAKPRDETLVVKVVVGSAGRGRRTQSSGV